MNTENGIGRLNDIGLDTIFLVNPKEMASQLKSRIAYAAKLLSTVTGNNRTESSEVISKCLGFGSYHDLSKNLAKFQGFGNKIPDSSVLVPIENSMFLVCVTECDDPPDRDVLDWYLNFAKVVSSATGLNENRILDDVCSPLFGDKNWLSLTSRTIRNCKKNLYSFICDDFNNPEGSGFFKASYSCIELQKELDRLVDADSLKAKGYLTLDCERLSWCTEILTVQPDFVPAALEVAEYYEIQCENRKSQKILNSSLEYLESLIPVDFNGEILSYGDNRLYYHVIKASVDNSAVMKHLKKAIRLTEKALALDTRDGFGFRFILPLLLVIDGQIPKAVEASSFITYDGVSQPDDFESEEEFLQEAFERDESAIPTLIKSIISYAKGDRAEFYYFMAKSLLSEPYLIRFVLDDPERDYPGRTKYDWDNEVSSFGYGSYFYWAYGSLGAIKGECVEFCNSLEFIRASKLAFEHGKKQDVDSRIDWLEKHHELINQMSFDLSYKFSKLMRCAAYMLLDLCSIIM